MVFVILVGVCRVFSNVFVDGEARCSVLVSITGSLLVMAWSLIIGMDFLLICSKIAFLGVTSGPVWGSSFGCGLFLKASTISS